MKPRSISDCLGGENRIVSSDPDGGSTKEFVSDDEIVVVARLALIGSTDALGAALRWLGGAQRFDSWEEHFNGWKRKGQRFDGW
jgi:hypothetical protein